FSELVRFLQVTGAFEAFARNALARLAIAGAPLPWLRAPGGADDAQSLLDCTRTQWGWESPEEAHVTMRDLGLGLDDVGESLEAEAVIRRLIAALGRGGNAAFSKALRSELWMNELSLKREAMRLGALKYFARRGAETGGPTEMQLDDARRCI